VVWLKKILLAVDGSESSKKAAKEAAKLASSLNAHVSLITVVTPNYSHNIETIEVSNAEMSMERMEEMREEKKKEGNRILDEAAQFLEKENIKVAKKVYEGNPAEKICQVAEEEDYDMIVVADKGLGGIKRFFLGSISDKVVRHANTSVLVVK